MPSHPLRQPEPAKMFPHRHSGVETPAAISIEGSGASWHFTVRADRTVITGTHATLAAVLQAISEMGLC